MAITEFVILVKSKAGQERDLVLLCPTNSKAIPHGVSLDCTSLWECKMPQHSPRTEQFLLQGPISMLGKELVMWDSL